MYLCHERNSSSRIVTMSWGLLFLVCICSLLNIQYDIYRASTVVGLLPHTQNYVCSLFLDVFTFLCVFSVGVCIGKPYCIYVHVSFIGFSVCFSFNRFIGIIFIGIKAC